MNLHFRRDRQHTLRIPWRLKESRGQGKWDFQTKTVAEGIPKPYYSSWQKADCWNSTINGNFVGAVKIRPGGRGGGFSDAGILKAVCGQGR